MAAKKTTGKYQPQLIEPKWQKDWEEKKIYQPDIDKAKRPFYNLMMFPYPSAEGLHVGNVYAFTGADVYGRFKRMQGNDVFEPIGLDGFGIHAENYALKIGKHPMDYSRVTEANFYRQLHAIGNGFDWLRTVETYKPNYYAWTQWLFIQLFKAGLAYKKSAQVNWCPSCKTVLADEQVINARPPATSSNQSENKSVWVAGEVGRGECERCGSKVEKRQLRQWFFRITAYAERLLNNISSLNWTKKVKIAQEQWIGRSEGAQIAFVIKGSHRKIEVFTTRPDTLFGATFIVLSPDHPLVGELALLNRKEVLNYVSKALLKTEQERLAEGREKKGVSTGLHAIHPVTKEEIPIWIADYVLMGYGTGAIMAVPAHDERDHEFAIKYKLPIRKVVDPHNEFQSLVMRKSVDIEKFTREVQDNGMWVVPYYDWGLIVWGRDDQQEEYLQIIQKHLVSTGWYADADGSLKAVIFKNKVFHLPKEDKQAREYARSLGIPEEQLDWQSEMNYAYCFNRSGQLVDSNGWNGWRLPEQIGKVIDWLEEKGVGKKEVTYHIRDWLISRQRYWGPPIPMIYCEHCAAQGRSWWHSDEAKRISSSESNSKYWEEWNSGGWYPVEDLPVILPHIEEYKPLGTGRSPLDYDPEFLKVKCPSCGKEAKREADVSDTFLDSSWYFLRYASTDLADKAFSKERTEKWLPVDMYIGGAEHSVLHLLYSRFITMFLHDQGLISFEEPYVRFYAHGLLIKEGAKMSKSKGNIVIPDEYIAKYGADTLRTYLMFLGPYDQGGDFRDTGIEGMHRFLKRVWTLFTNESVVTEQKEELQIVHKTIKEVTEEMEGLRYNVVIAKLMILYNFLAKRESISKETVKIFLKLLAPFAPHISEELWSREALRSKGSRFAETRSGSPAKQDLAPQDARQSVHLQPWPQYNPEYLKEETVTIVVQVNGKLRDSLRVPADQADKEQVERLAKESTNTAKHLEGKSLKNVIYIPDKLINFVVA